MEKELQHQLRIMLEENDNGNYYELTKTISSFINQNFVGKEEVREKIENMKCDYPKSSSQKEHQINIEIIERTVNQIREELLKQTK